MEADLLNQQLIVFNFIACNNGTVQSIFNVPNTALKFNPDYFKVEQLSVSINNLNDSMYVLNSSLTDGLPICSFTGRTNTTLNLSELGILRAPPEQLSFSLGMLAADGLGNQSTTGLTNQVSPVFAGGTYCYISLSVNFFKFRPNRR